ncbi:conserved Plasmodium protein, unknown function [Plasmodium malariae]|uniref:Uncharacterized protein n=1 Tax=Plasmodium malariae TaxID=5858 RepID=A0A1D3TD33_PLAMA|nr:conserved Plasmodium protein, unknown function [Plasmodium malariae]SCP02804.1 conserved Plasmodium protein, unknown function [Plasmodium malariae]
MEFLKSYFDKILKKKGGKFNLSNLSEQLNDPFTFFFMCIFLFVFVSLITYLYCFCKSYDNKKGSKVHKMSKKVK